MVVRATGANVPIAAGRRASGPVSTSNCRLFFFSRAHDLARLLERPGVRGLGKFAQTGGCSAIDMGTADAYQRSIQGRRSSSAPGAARLAMQVPVSFPRSPPDRGCRPATWARRARKTSRRIQAVSIHRVDHNVGNVYALRRKLARRAAPRRPCLPLAKAWPGGRRARSRGSRVRDGALPARHHALRHLTAHRRAANASHLPHLEEHARGRLAGVREIDVGADVVTATLWAAEPRTRSCR